MLHAAAPLLLSAAAAAAPAGDAALAWAPVANASWAPRAHFGATRTASGALLLTGGITVANNTHLNEVWRSGDGGATWALATAAAPWRPRHRHGAALLGACVYVFGGCGSADAASGAAGDAYYNDVWRSCDDGSTWDRVLAQAPWAGREGFATAVAGGEVLMIGGTGAAAAGAEVWATRDGAAWELRSGNATAPPTPWPARYATSAAVTAAGEVLVAAGFSTGVSELNDAWASADAGRTWARRSAGAAWPKRAYAALATCGGWTYLIGGQAPASKLFRSLPDAWATRDGAAWQRLADPPIAPRGGMGALCPGGLVVFGGSSEMLPRADYHDVWTAAAA